MKNLYYILFLFVFVSCTRDVSIEIDTAEEQIVVEGGIENGKAPFVYLTKSVAIYGDFDFNNLQDYLVTNATVTVSNGTYTDTLVPTVNLSGSLPLFYTPATPRFVGEFGKSYALSIEVDGKKLTSSTTIPYPVELDSVWIQEEAGRPGDGFVWGHLNDPDTSGNSYFWKQRMPSEPDFVAPLGAAFNDRIINGQAFDFFFQKPFDSEDEDLDPRDAIYYQITDTVIVQFSAIDNASLDFWRTLDMSKSNGGNPFAAPITPITNIKGGGLGVFTGYAVSYDTAYFMP